MRFSADALDEPAAATASQASQASGILPTAALAFLLTADPFPGRTAPCRPHKWRLFAHQRYINAQLDAALAATLLATRTGQPVRPPPHLAAFGRLVVPADAHLLICEHCRMTAAVAVARGASGAQPNHFHHLHPVRSDSAVPSDQDRKRSFAYSCCECHSTVSVVFGAPVISVGLFDKLRLSRTSRDHLRNLFKCLLTWSKGALPTEDVSSPRRAIKYGPDTAFEKYVGMRKGGEEFFAALGFAKNEEASQFEPPEFPGARTEEDIERAHFEIVFAEWYAHVGDYRDADHMFATHPTTMEQIGMHITANVVGRRRYSLWGGGSKEDLDLLGVTQDDPDEAIVHVLKLLCSHRPHLAAMYGTAVARVAEARNSDAMALEAAQAMSSLSAAPDTPMHDAPPQHQPDELDLASALSVLGMAETSPPDILRVCFQVRAGDTPGIRGRLVDAVRTIGVARGWDWAVNWASRGCPDEDFTGGDPGWEVPVVVEDAAMGFGGAAGLASPELPAGLHNHGSTCYLNSLLQLLFSLKPVRDAVLSLVCGEDRAAEQDGGAAGGERAEANGTSSSSVPGDWVEDTRASPKPADGKSVDEERKNLLAHRQKLFLAHLGTLFAQLLLTNRRYVTPNENLVGIVMLSADDWLSHHRGAGPSSAFAPGAPPSEGGPSSAADRAQVSQITQRQQDITEAWDSVQTLLEQLLVVHEGRETIQTGDGANPGSFWSRTWSGKRKREAAGQTPLVTQDVREWVRVDNAPPPGSKDSLVQRLFFGSVTQHLAYKPHGDGALTTATKTESFSHLLLEARETLTTSLDAYFGDSVVEYEGDTAAHRHVVLANCPTVMTFVLNRVQFDATAGNAYKNQAFTSYPLRIDLGRYEAAWERRRGILETERDLKSRLDSLKDRKKAAEDPVALEQTLDYVVNNIGEDDPDRGNNIESLLRRIEDARNVIGEVDSELERCNRELSVLWDGLTTEDSRYVLHAVLVHEGEAVYGHYWIYIRDSSPPFGPRWLKFNDTVVTVVPEGEVIRDTTGRNANAYGLVYVREQDVDVFNVFARYGESQDAYKQRFASILSLGMDSMRPPSPQLRHAGQVDSQGDTRMDGGDAWQLAGEA